MCCSPDMTPICFQSCSSLLSSSEISSAQTEKTEENKRQFLPAQAGKWGQFMHGTKAVGTEPLVLISWNYHGFQSHCDEQHDKFKTKYLCSRISPLRGQHHRIPIETVDVVMAPPHLLSVHTQGLAVHHLVQNLWSESRWTENNGSMKEDRELFIKCQERKNRSKSDGRRAGMWRSTIQRSHQVEHAFSENVLNNSRIPQ